jgi:hypothetical protein
VSRELPRIALDDRHRKQDRAIGRMVRKRRHQRNGERGRDYDVQNTIT